MQMASYLGSRGPRILKPTLFKMSCFNVEAFQGVYWATHKSIYVCFLLPLLFFCLLSPFPAVLDLTPISEGLWTLWVSHRPEVTAEGVIWIDDFNIFSQSMQTCGLWNHLVGICEHQGRRKRKKREGRMEQWRIWKKMREGEREKRGKERRKKEKEWVKEGEGVSQQLEEINFKCDICDKV